MKTTKEDRATRLEMLEQNVKDGGTFHRGVLDFESRLIADVDETTLLLKEWMNGKELPAHWTDRVRTYLQEPNKGVNSDKE